MGKEVNLTIEYYDNSFDLEKVYENLLSESPISYFDNNYYLVDFDPVQFDLELFGSMKEVLLDAIRTNKTKPLVFSLIFKDIITHHTLNAVYSRELNIAISDCVILPGFDIPDFSFYVKNLIPYFSLFEIQRISFSYG